MVLVPRFLRPEVAVRAPGRPDLVEDRIVLVHDFMYGYKRSWETAFRNFLRGQPVLGLQG